MDGFKDFVHGFELPELIIMLGVGLAILLFGYRIKKIAFFVVWFLLGYCGLTYLMPEIVKIWPEMADNQLFQILLPIGGGLLLALLGFTIEKLCVAGISFALVMLVSVQYFGTEIHTLAISAVVGVIAAALAVLLMKPATIIATAAMGAYVLTLAILELAPDINQEIFYWPLLIGMTTAGSLFQFITTKRMS